jgi:hypothetical protein
MWIKMNYKMFWFLTDLWKGKDKSGDHESTIAFTEQILKKEFSVENILCDTRDERIEYYMEKKESFELYCNMMYRVYNSLHSDVKKKFMQTWYLNLFSDRNEKNRINWRQTFICMVLLSKNENLLNKVTKEIQFFMKDKTERQLKFLNWAVKFFINGNELIKDLQSQFFKIKHKEYLASMAHIQKNTVTTPKSSPMKKRVNVVTPLEEEKMKKIKVEV